jgi:TorA maturation chaperone TorD
MSEDFLPFPYKEEMQILAMGRVQFSAFLKSHFLNLPDEEFITPLRKADFLNALGAIQTNQDLHPDIIRGAGLMQGYLENHQHTSSEELSQLLGKDRTRLYRGVSPSYGPPPPYETVWNPTKGEASALLKELNRIYQESNLTQAPGARERPDYIGMQLGYIESMAEMEDKAWQRDDETGALEAFERQRAFLVEHLDWVSEFIESALQEAETDFYTGHLLMLRGFLVQQADIFAQLSQQQGS